MGDFLSISGTIGTGAGLSALAPPAYTRSLWNDYLAASIDLGDLAGVNGEAIETTSGTAITDVGGGNFRVEGLTDTIVIPGMCVRITAVGTATATLTLYEVVGASNGHPEISDTPVNGGAAIAIAGTVDAEAGGIAQVDNNGDFTNFVDSIDNDIDGTANSYEALLNAGFTAVAGITISNPGTVLFPVTFTGCDSDFIRATVVSDQPVIDMGTAFITISGAFVRFRNIAVTSAMITSNSGVILQTGVMGIIDHCRVSNTSTSASARATIRLNNGTMVSNCHVSTVTTRTNPDSSAIYSTARSQILNNFVESTRIGIQITGSVTQTACGNIIVGNDTGSGISVALSGTRGFLCNYNSIYDFTEGINVSTAMSSPIGNVIFANNIIWGGTTGTVKGIANVGSATAIYFYINNNAIGNVDTAYEFGDLIIENVITLTVNPFSGSTFDSADEFKLNSTAGGGALCLETALPNDFDNEGTRDGWADVGALQAEPTGAAGGVMPLTGLLG